MLMNKDTFIVACSLQLNVNICLIDILCEVQCLIIIVSCVNVRYCIKGNYCIQQV